jgi:DNA-binding GntR family transcriptional regulator
MKDTAHTEIERCCNAIYQAIFERRLEPKTRLVESQLAKALSTSRANARQALLLLAQRKLVKITQNKGAVVAEPSKAEAHEVFAARRCIEREVIRHVYERCTPENIQILRDHLEVERQARESHDHFELIRATGKFHVLLAEIAGNSVLLDFLEQLIARSSLILEKFKTHNDQTCQEWHHTELVKLIAERKVEKAQDLMDQHLKEIEQVLNYKRKTKPADLSEVFAPFLENHQTV